MIVSDWLNLFKKYAQIKVFHVNHLKLLSGLSDHTLRIALGRLNNKKIIARICRGFYANPFNLPSLEEISGQIYPPNYISLESALSSYNILSQIPQTLTCVTTRLPRAFKTSFGIIEFRQIKNPYFWGFINKNGYSLAEKEKALLDYIYLNTKNKQLGPPALNTEEINKSKFFRYARQMNLEKPARSFLENIKEISA